jgi:hypothetical protein
MTQQRTKNAHGYLIGEPADVVWATEDNLPGWLSDACEGILDALRDLFLVVNFPKQKVLYRTPTQHGIISLNARTEIGCRHSRHSSASRRFQTGLALTSTRSRRILHIDEWGNEKKKLRSGDGGDQMHNFLPSCEIRDLKTDAKHDTRPIRKPRTSRGPKWQNNSFPTHFEINSRHM